MRKGIMILGLSVSIILVSSHVLFAQGGRKHIREGNRHYNQENFQKSELEYRKALEQNRSSVEGLFNLGAAMYRQEKFGEAAKNFSKVPENLKDPLSISSFYHNLGNSLLQSQQVEESIEAYKHALRHNPADNETRYNLAYAHQLLNQQQNRDQNQQQNQDKQNNQDQEDNKEQNDRKEDQKQENQQNPEQQPERSERISREDAERLLQALENEERKVQDKLKREQAADKSVRVIKNW